MLRLRAHTALLVVLLLVPGLRAQDKSAPKWVEDRSLTLSPRQAPVPALKYRLFPLDRELKPGNAVPIYLRLAHEQSDAARKYWSETPRAWNQLPIDRIPLKDAHEFLKHYQHRFLRQLEIGARRKTAEWNYTSDEPNPIGMLLPDIQQMRNYAPMLVLQARVAIAEGNFAAAVHHLETGFAYSRHVAEGPTLIQRLVGNALAAQFTDVVADFIARPKAPNLYWALATLPRPLIDLRPALEWEYGMIEQQIPELADVARDRSPAQWDETLRRLRIELRKLAGLGAPNQRFFPKNTAPADPAAISPDLPEAQKYVARTSGLSPEKVEAMPPAQVLLLYIAGTTREDRDMVFRTAYLPFPQTYPFVTASHKFLRDGPVTEGHAAARMLLPAFDRVLTRRALLERRLAALRAIEAVRIYAAAHGGALPEKLDDITEVPVPKDPGTDRPFEYRRDGATATLISREPAANDGVRYRLTIRK